MPFWNRPADEQPRAASPNWLLLAYAIEFLLALMAIITVWSEIGGQGHLDLMPWYAKLACVLAAAWCSVRFTAGIVEEKKLWTSRTVVWFAGILIMAVVMGAITYYYHLHEEEIPADSDDTTTAVMNAAPAAGWADLNNDRITI